MACTCDTPIQGDVVRRGWSGEFHTFPFCASCGESFGGPAVGPAPRRKKKLRKTREERAEARKRIWARRVTQRLAYWGIDTHEGRERERVLNAERAALYSLPIGTRLRVTEALRPSRCTGAVAGRAGRAPLERGRVYLVVGPARDDHWRRAGLVQQSWLEASSIHLVAEGGDAAECYFATPGEFRYLVIGRVEEPGRD
jgi:hypothetical protein